MPCSRFVFPRFPDTQTQLMREPGFYGAIFWGAIVLRCVPTRSYICLVYGQCATIVYSLKCSLKLNLFFPQIKCCLNKYVQFTLFKSLGTQWHSVLIDCSCLHSSGENINSYVALTKKGVNWFESRKVLAKTSRLMTPFDGSYCLSTTEKFVLTPDFFNIWDYAK